MTTRPPAEIGMSLDEVDTPALIVDLDAFESNLRRLAERVKGSGVRLRPHAKTHKCPVIALKQMELGAVGVCCQKRSEEHTSELQSRFDLVCRLLLEKKKEKILDAHHVTTNLIISISDSIQMISASN